MKVCYFDITVEACIERLGKVRALISEVLASTVEESIQNKILTCFSEIFTNSCEHGNAKDVATCAYREGPRFYLVVSDSGEEFDAGNETQDCVGTFNVERESGRGLGIVKLMSDEIITRREGDRNVYVLSWPMALEDRRKKVLLVDDDRAISALYEQYLCEDFNVVVCHSVNEAFGVLGALAPDIVISDINMPDINGIEFRRSLLEEDKEGLFPFVFLTMDEGDFIDDAIQVGIDDYIKKPITRNQLVATVNRVLMRFQHLRNGLNKRIDKRISAALTPALPKRVFDFDVCSHAVNTGAGGGDLVVYHNTGSAAYIVLVDVMGHDDAAKFFAYAYAGFLRGSFSADDDISPALLLHNLSQQVYLDAFLSEFNLTCCVVKVHPGKKVELASAGHPAPMLIRSDEVSFIPVQGMMLGLMEGASYQTVEVELGVGERLALYTDGLFEGAGAPESRLLLERRMLETLGKVGASLEEDMERSMNVLFDVVNNAPTDDALLILME